MNTKRGTHIKEGSLY